MNEKEILALKRKIYGGSSERTGIPVEYYELSPQQIADYEAEKRKAAKKRSRKKARLPLVYTVPQLCKRAPIIHKFDDFGQLD